MKKKGAKAHYCGLENYQTTNGNTKRSEQTRTKKSIGKQGLKRQ